MRYATLVTILALGSFFTSSATSDCRAASPTGWSPIVLPTGSYRTQIKSMPIVARPGRFLHVYGNTVRMIDLSRKGAPVRPMRQIFIGTTDLRGEAQ